ncbi:MAG: hypothetical protein LBD70_04330, partial [Bifidobacteriaceae bacterium]|nr:hypothetical protein [Bifidobacteriaceae bacterium]
MKQAGPAAAGGAAALPRVHLALGRVATSARIKAVNCPVLGIGVAAGPDGLEPDQGSAEAAVRYGIDFAATAERAGFTGRAGQTLVLELPVEHSAASAWSRLAPMVVLVGVGGGDPDDYRRAGASLARA